MQFFFTCLQSIELPKRSNVPAMPKLNEKSILSFLFIGSLGQCRFENILTSENEMNLRH